MKGNFLMLLVGAMALTKTEEEIVDKLTDSLLKYKNSGFAEESKPVKEFVMLQMKWANPDNSMETMMDQVQEAEKINNLHQTMTGSVN